MNEILYRRSQTALVADVGEDVVALNVQRNETYGMAGVTASVWKLLSEPMSLPQLCDRLGAAYAVDSEVCRREVAALLEEMVAAGLVEPAIATGELQDGKDASRA